MEGIGKAPLWFFYQRNIQNSDSSFALDISQSFTAYETLMPIISMNLMETLLQNEYTKCNESIPYKTFDHYTELFCQRNCLWDQIKSECSCRPVYVAEKHFPNYTG